MLDHSCQVGRRPLAERGHDLYSTPDVAVEALLRVWTPPAGIIWEPASGLNPIVKVLRAHGHDVIASDLVDYGADPTAHYGVDFLTAAAPPGVTSIITNPPFKLIEQFVAHAIELVPCAACCAGWRSSKASAAATCSMTPVCTMCSSSASACQ